MSVNHSGRSSGTIEICFSIFFDIMVCCLFSLESPHRGDSNEYTQHTTLITIKKKTTKIYPKYNMSAAIEFFPRDLRKGFEIAVVNELSVFEPLKFYCILTICCRREVFSTFFVL